MRLFIIVINIKIDFQICKLMEEPRNFINNSQRLQWIGCRDKSWRGSTFHFHLYIDNPSIDMRSNAIFVDFNEEGKLICASFDGYGCMEARSDSYLTLEEVNKYMEKPENWNEVYEDEIFTEIHEVVSRVIKNSNPPDYWIECLKEYNLD